MASCERGGVASQVQVSALELSGFALTSMHDVSQDNEFENQPGLTRRLSFP